VEAPQRCPEGETLADLLRQIREGSLPAFNRFYEVAAPFVMGLSCKMLGDRMEAEDVCHDVLMTVISTPERYDPARGSVEAWLAVLAKSRCLDRLRRRKRVVLDSADGRLTQPWASDAGELEGRVLNRLEREALRRALRELPGSQRQTLAAAFYDSRSQRELAEAWNVPLGTVKSRVRYGLSHLRKAMEKLGWAEGGGRGD